MVRVIQQFENRVASKRFLPSFFIVFSLDGLNDAETLGRASVAITYQVCEPNGGAYSNTASVTL